MKYRAGPLNLVRQSVTLAGPAKLLPRNVAIITDALTISFIFIAISYRLIVEHVV